MTQLTKEEAAKELLKPYFDDPTLCSVGESGECAYRGLGGNMCVFARACTPEGREKLIEGFSADSLLERLGVNILQQRYRHLCSTTLFWWEVQATHDSLVNNGKSPTTRKLYLGVTGEELPVY